MKSIAKAMLFFSIICFRLLPNFTHRRRRSKARVLRFAKAKLRLSRLLLLFPKPHFIRLWVPVVYACGQAYGKV
jgi:hypothetical protein